MDGLRFTWRPRDDPAMLVGLRERTLEGLNQPDAADQDRLDRPHSLAAFEQRLHIPERARDAVHRRGPAAGGPPRDRESTRLKSRHKQKYYALFFFEKKKNN